jgi:hypothetical protein
MLIFGPLRRQKPDFQKILRDLRKLFGLSKKPKRLPPVDWKN